MPVLEEDWRLIQRMLTGYGDRALHGGLTDPGSRQEGRQRRHRAAGLRLQAAVREAVHPAAHQLDPADSAGALRRRGPRSLAGRITELFQPYFGMTADEISATPRPTDQRAIQGTPRRRHQGHPRRGRGQQHRGRERPDHPPRLRQRHAAREHLLPRVQVHGPGGAGGRTPTCAGS